MKNVMTKEYLKKEMSPAKMKAARIRAIIKSSPKKGRWNG